MASASPILHAVGHWAQDVEGGSFFLHNAHTEMATDILVVAPLTLTCSSHITNKSPMTLIYPHTRWYPVVGLTKRLLPEVFRWEQIRVSFVSRSCPIWDIIGSQAGFVWTIEATWWWGYNKCWLIRAAGHIRGLFIFATQINGFQLTELEWGDEEDKFRKWPREGLLGIMYTPGARINLPKIGEGE